MAALKNQQLKEKEREDGRDKKLTGRELFMSDKTLIDSDLKFLEEGGEVVRVDESLFQDLDDLELEDLDDEDKPTSDHSD